MTRVPDSHTTWTSKEIELHTTDTITTLWANNSAALHMNKFYILNPFANQGELCHLFKEKAIQHWNTHPKMGPQQGGEKATQPPHPCRQGHLERLKNADGK
jgi:hypothetical protein